MKSVSVRTKLTLWNVGVLALTLSLLGLAVFYGARQSLLAAVDKDMRQRADRLIQRVTPSIKTPPSERRIRIANVAAGAPVLILPWDPHRPVRTFQIGKNEYEAIDNPRQPASTDPTRSPIRPRILELDGSNPDATDKPYDVAAYNGAKLGKSSFSDTVAPSSNDKSKPEVEPIRLYSTPIVIDGKVVRVLQYPQTLAGTYNALNGLTWTLLTVLPLILIVSAFGGAFLTGTSLKPVRDMTQAAAQVSAESLAGRLDVKGHDEFSRLAQTFNGMLERLQGAFTRMEQAVEQQRRFTADASHELRTPLTVIKANTSLALKGKRSPEEYQKTLAAVNAAADSMNRLVNDLLLLARSDNGKLQVNAEPTCLKPLLKEAVASVARPGVADISLIMADDGVEIVGDGHQILRVFVNLIENAARYTPEDGRISVVERIEDGNVVVSVQDTGIGIDPEHLPHLTDRFYRVDDARARAEGGNGLGLSICSSIVEAHNGSIGIASAPGKGTTVTVKLPVSS